MSCPAHPPPRGTGRPWVAGQAGPAGDRPTQPRLPGGRWAAGRRNHTPLVGGCRKLSRVRLRREPEKLAHHRAFSAGWVKLRGAFSSPLRSAGLRGVGADRPPIVLRSLRAPAGGSACPPTRGVCPEHPPPRRLGRCSSDAMGRVASGGQQLAPSLP